MAVPFGADVLLHVLQQQQQHVLQQIIRLEIHPVLKSTQGYITAKYGPNDGHPHLAPHND